MSHVSSGLDSRRATFGTVNPAEPNPVPPHLRKYWAQRYRLFHRYDDGIELDEEGWYSVTPERIAYHIAQRFKGLGVVADLFSGPGGNSIQFALNGSFVIGVEHSADRISMAMNNARVYGVDGFMDFIQGDVYAMLPGLAARAGVIDGIFMSPPWGGPEYQFKTDEFYDVSVFKAAVQGARSITDNVAILVPRNVDLQNICNTFGNCQVEKNFLSGKLKTQTIYFGDLITHNANSNVVDMVAVVDVPARVPHENVVCEVPKSKKNRRRNRRRRSAKLNNSGRDVDNTHATGVTEAVGVSPAVGDMSVPDVSELGRCGVVPSR